MRTLGSRGIVSRHIGDCGGEPGREARWRVSGVVGQAVNTSASVAGSLSALAEVRITMINLLDTPSLRIASSALPIFMQYASHLINRGDGTSSNL